MKAVDEKANVGVAIRIHFDEVCDNIEGVCLAIFCIQFFNRKWAFAGSHVDRVVKMEQE